MHCVKRILPLWIAVFAAMVLPASAESDTGDLAEFERLQLKLADIADDARPSVVAIRAERRVELANASGEDSSGGDGETRRGRTQVFPAVGTGTIISANGLILTNEHVIHNASPDSIECILFDGQIYTVQGITSDPRSDLAVLRIDARNLKPARFGDLSTVRQGHFAIVMGNPYGSASENSGRPAMSFGIISAIGQDLTQKLDVLQQHYYGNLLQTDARIHPGNSGGPLLNLKGEVIGVTTAISTRSGSGEGVGYAISIDQRTKDIIDQLVRGEEVEYGMLGVKLEPPTDNDRRVAGGPLRGGAVVRQVEAGTPAAQSDLRAGDIISEFDRNVINDVDQLIRLVGAARVGRKVNVVLFRQNQRLVIGVEPARKDVLRGVRIETPLDWRGMRISDPSVEILRAFKLTEPVAGVVVTQVEANGSAQKAGLRPGHVIREIAGEPVKGVRRFRDLAATLTGPVRVVLDGESAAERTLP